MKKKQNTKSVHTVVRLNFKEAPIGKITRYQFEIAGDGLGYPIHIPIIVARGKSEGPTLGITAVIHGNELNGLPVIRRIFKELDVSSLKGTVVGVPVLNIPGFLEGTRKFNDGTDLNHCMPGKESGNRSSVYAYRIFTRIISQFDSLIDLHTASFGRINSFYIRANMENKTMATMARLLGAEIILHNEGSKGSLRRAAADRGITTVTAELRDPYKFQKKVIRDGVRGIMNILCHFGMQKEDIQSVPQPVICKRSYWIYTDQGGLLTVIPSLLAQVKKGEVIARVRNVFGDILAEYTSPDDGIVIGKSINPVNQTGSRIIHLGILQD